jgi:serine/threonine-protein kinase
MPRQTLAGLVAVGIAIVSILATWLLTRPADIAPLPAQALSVTLPEEHDFVEAALSPDGTTLVYVAIADGRTQLFVRSIATFAVEPLAGTADATQPFFSPDGKRVGFFAAGFLRWVSLDGGAPVDVAPVAGETAGASWSASDEIIFAPLGGQGLQRVSSRPLADESTPTVSDVTQLNEDADEIAHGWPHLLPDGQSIVFTVGRNEREPRLAWMSLETRDRQLLEPADGPAFHVDSGHFVYTRRGEIFAMPVDVGEQTVTGPVRLVASGVSGSPVGYNRLGQSSLAASRSGLLAYAPESDAAPDNLLVWVDRDGSAEPVDGVPARHQTPRVSPDGSLIAMAVSAGTFTRDLWVLDVATGTRQPITQQAGDNHSPLWADDGRGITFSSNRDGPQRVYRATPTGSRLETLLFGDGRTPGSWSPDDRNLFFHELQGEQGRDIWVWTPGSGESTLLLGGSANERSPAISPDGRRLAYVSDAEDGDQVYVRPFPGTADERVSPAGGTEPVWSPDGSELFFRRGRDLVAVEITADTNQVSAPRRLFSGSFVRNPGGNVAAYDIDQDGSRFLMLQPVGRTQTLSIINQWQDTVFRDDRVGVEP